MRLRSTLNGSCQGIAIVAVALGCASCSVEIPADPNGSLEAIHERGSIRVGASQEPQLVDHDDGVPRGSLVRLVTGFAEDQNVEIEWTWGSEETLVTHLEEERIDVAVGGFTDASPWASRAGMTRGYPEIPDAHGRPLVILVPLGENRLLSELEQYLDAEVRP